MTECDTTVRIKLYDDDDDDDELVIIGHRSSPAKTWLCILPCILTVGIVPLLFYWIPRLYLKCMFRTCSLSEATKVLIKGHYSQVWVKDIYIVDRDGSKMERFPSEGLLALTSTDSWSHLRYFNYQKIKFLWNEQVKTFERLKGFENGMYASILHSLAGTTSEQHKIRTILYGDNIIGVPITPLFKLFIKEVLTPFYIFQVFSFSLWYADGYTYYASCIVFLSVVSMAVSLYQTRKNQRNLCNTAMTSTVIPAHRGTDGFHEINSADLVPGDVIEIPRQGCMMPCDAVLLTGSAIVNESMLTGESIPVTKTPLPNPTSLGHADLEYDLSQHARHTLFCGTKVIQTRFYESHRVKAVVVRTGFATLKGELIRSILYPKPVNFKFNRHTYGYIGVLGCIALIGFIYAVFRMVEFGYDTGRIVRRALDLITITVPPALPAAMTIGLVYAQLRLRKKSNVYCISPQSINIAGSINCCVFDKTGTLTEDGLDLMEVVPSNPTRFESPVAEPEEVASRDLILAMAACHSLIRIDGQLTGDPLDLKLFEWTKWQLEESGTSEEENRFDTFAPTTVRPPTSSPTSPENYGIMRQFPFSSKLQRMSVVSRGLNAKHFVLFTKGSPEIIRSLCKEGIPADFLQVQDTYTKRGLRVIAMAYRKLSMNYLKVQRATREELEWELTFLGLVVLENRLKPQTKPVIETLLKANIRCSMATGDNLLTALSVARECGLMTPKEQGVLIDTDTSGMLQMTTENNEPVSDGVFASPFRFVVTGRALELIFKNSEVAFHQVCVRGTVFARMSPDQKQILVEGLQHLGYFVGMCGDGANDCGALKAAHMGISLSEAEASVASSFTSKTPDISAVPAVIREGRAALATSFGVFKYMAAYSVTQHVSVLFLYWIGSGLGDFQFLYIDLALITALVFLAARAEACRKLSRYPPPSSLISVRPIMSLVVQLVLMIAGLTAAYLISKSDPNFEEYDHEEKEEGDYAGFENTAVFSCSLYMYITQAIIYSKGKPYRKRMYTNVLFLLYTFVVVAFSTLIILYPEPFNDFFELEPDSDFWYRLIYVDIGVLYFFLSWLIEDGIIENTCWRQRFAHRKTQRSVKPYRRIERAANTKQSLTDAFNEINQTLQSESNGVSESAVDVDEEFEQSDENDEMSRL